MLVSTLVSHPCLCHGYEEFLAAVYEAENEGTQGKVLNKKAKAMMVEKVIEEREKSELKDLKQ